MTQTTFKTEDITTEQLKKFIEDNPLSGNYYERQAVLERFLENWRSPEGLSLKEIRAEVDRITSHYNKQAGALVDAIMDVSRSASNRHDRDWEFIDRVDEISDAAISQYGYDSYSYGTWVQSNY